MNTITILRANVDLFSWLAICATLLLVGLGIGLWAGLRYTVQVERKRQAEIARLKQENARLGIALKVTRFAAAANEARAVAFGIEQFALGLQAGRRQLAREWAAKAGLCHRHTDFFTLK